jgi:hypothetical protein
MSKNIATVFHNGKVWEVTPSLITLNHLDAMDHWDLSGVYMYLSTKTIADVKVEFIDVPAVDRWTGPFTLIPEFKDSEQRLYGCPHNKKFGVYTYDIIVKFSDTSQGEFRLFLIDPQIDNVAPPPPPPPFGPEDDADYGVKG